ncbi:MAG: DUF3127 domain-containing protein [Flavobacteriales bacterium]|nr:DUF3127 domain-containing protein [Flavobacteriales bacterium]MCB0794724.1 DUF3127 domain-containing protein [Flavobacteriales bacterium]
MATYTISGTIKSIGKTQDISDKFRKRELILLEAVGQRDQPVPIEFTQDRTGLLDGFEPGEQVTVSFFINGREWVARDGTVKYFLSLSAQRIDRAGAAPAAGAPPLPPPPTAKDEPISGDDEDDLPF